jgi:hypothetical protein
MQSHNVGDRASNGELRLLRLHENRGKGAALKMGVRGSRGDLILIVSIFKNQINSLMSSSTVTFDVLLLREG